MKHFVTMVESKLIIVYLCIQFSQLVAKPSSLVIFKHKCTEEELYSKIKMPTRALLTKINGWKKPTCLCAEKQVLGIPSSYNSKDLKLNEYIGIFKAIGEKLTNQKAKEWIMDFWKSLEQTREESYDCERSNIDFNAGKSKPEPWFRFKINTGEKCCKDTSAVDSELLYGIARDYLLRMITDFKL